MSQDFLRIRGARTHNLRNIDLDIPRNQLVVITGLSGSGKSSLAFDTLYAEGQRRYVESLSTYARQFLQLMDKPDVDSIEGLSPAISIEQKATSHNPRSTVGTVTEIHDYLRVLFARAGTPYCPEHRIALQAQSVGQMVDTVLALAPDTRVMILAPIARARKGEFAEQLAQLQAQGYVRFRIDGAVCEAGDLPHLKKNEKHDIDVVLDRIKVRADGADALRQRLAESFEAALRLADGRALAVEMDRTVRENEGLHSEGRDTPIEHPFNLRFGCPHCGYAVGELEPKLFSFNSPIGACPSCDGLGVQEYFDPQRVVEHPDRSLADGAIRGWDKSNSFYFAMLDSLAQHYGCDIHLPFSQLPQRVQQAVLYGSGDEDILFRYSVESRYGQRDVDKKHPFEGVLPNMQRRYMDTDSAAVREALSRLRSVRVCPECDGTRLREQARMVRIGDGSAARTLAELSHCPLSECLEYFRTLHLPGVRGEIAARIVRDIVLRLQFLQDVGLGYLCLDRSADTLSGGEAQRIRLASQIGSGLTGVMYVLDEPSIGLHQRDNDRLIGTLRHLRDLGNSVLVVEHDEDMMRSADHLIDIGPGAGIHGGHVVAHGTVDEVCAVPSSLTGQYLVGSLRIDVPPQRRAAQRDKDGVLRAMLVQGARGNNLRNIDVAFPVGLFTCVTGVSGSGKSTLVNDTLYRSMARALYKAREEPAPHTRILGLEHIDKVIDVDQSPIGRTPRSNPATYTGLFTPIRELLAEVPLARERGYAAGRFSFNVSQSAGGGRCEACEGDGVVKVEMHFLSDVYVQCEVCGGKRYNRETLEVLYKGKNIADILDLTVEAAHEFFGAIPAIARRLRTLIDVGLGYIKLGQSATTLSGGEAQRVKLALELSRRDTGRTLYILDEPTTGLHFADVRLLLQVLHQLCDAGNTVVVIEHHLDVIKTADWIVDIGPEGGNGGGTVVGTGTPEQLAILPHSHTGHYLAPYLRRPGEPCRG
ncbi:excinuclease ABC subunit UvrA [Candidatus Symbiobacter mobilis]|uniref:UvrABC system protein A n=1 Tax=Candidatus Symbiobacter mobilis CR TaxID=946483 RepID=U5N9N1_9BURK|nr:excinuclease ABC subunit UvrA [Candidatus Symbiobacter mobilis]AGX88117.1 excinuclease ABC subunit A [Candidatus Symbiobacter mobilis CR]